MEHTRQAKTALQAHREARFERPIQLAAACGLSLQAVLNLEAGKNGPTLRSARAISEALGVPIDVLFPAGTSAGAAA